MLDWPAKITAMKQTGPFAALPQQYDQLRRQLSQVGFISQGSVQDRTGRKGGGAGYQWTRKVAQKTITVALTLDQFEKLKEAVHNYRKLRKQLQEMEKLSRRIIFQTSQHPARSKRLRATVLGIN